MARVLTVDDEQSIRTSLGTFVEEDSNYSINLEQAHSPDGG